MSARVRRHRGWLALLLAAALLLTGCSGDDREPGAATEASSTPSPSVTAEPAPEAGQCHRISLEQAARPVADDDGTVRCSEPHTSLTVAVEQLDTVQDGHLLTLDSPTVQRRLARTCGPRLLARAGGDETTRRLSRLQVVWFTPSQEQAQAGADWVRCDVVAVADDDRLLRLPPRLRGLLDDPEALDTYGTCGTASPGADDFRRVACARPHTWRAIDVVDLPADATFLDQAVTDDADATCETIATDAAGGSLELTWAFEWPTRAQWRSGQRHGWCWTPTA